MMDELAQSVKKQSCAEAKNTLLNQSDILYSMAFLK